MKNLKYVFSIVLLTFIIGCGYTPLKTSENINFYIIELNIQGDRQINNIILSKLKKYQKPDENKKKIILNISTNYKKNVVNKDKNGNQKNYKISITNIVKFNLGDGKKLSKNFIRNSSLSAQDKKIDEREAEKIKKLDLAKLLTDDIVFYLINNN